MSTKPSGISGAMLWRAGAGGTGSPKTLVRAETSLMSEKRSLLMSAGQASSALLSAQPSSGSVPMTPSAAFDQPSRSLSGTGVGVAVGDAVALAVGVAEGVRVAVAAGVVVPVAIG